MRWRPTSKKHTRPVVTISTPSPSNWSVCWAKSKPCFKAGASDWPAPEMSSSGQQPLAKIRHELRTPINHIIGFSEILLEETPGQVPQSFLDDLQKIRNGGDRLLA